MSQADDMAAEQARHNLGIRIIQVAMDHAEGYRRNISQFNTAHENETAERCACAASNTGWFLLKALGYSDEKIKQLKMDARGIAPPPAASASAPTGESHEE